MKKLWPMIAIVHVCSPLLTADTIYLKSSQKIEGRILQQTDSLVVIQTDAGQLSLQMDLVREIEKSPDTAQNSTPNFLELHSDIGLQSYDSFRLKVKNLHANNDLLKEQTDYLAHLEDEYLQGGIDIRKTLNELDRFQELGQLNLLKAHLATTLEINPYLWEVRRKQIDLLEIQNQKNSREYLLSLSEFLFSAPVDQSISSRGKLFTSAKEYAKSNSKSGDQLDCYLASRLAAVIAQWSPDKDYPTFDELMLLRIAKEEFSNHQLSSESDYSQQVSLLLMEGMLSQSPYYQDLRTMTPYVHNFLGSRTFQLV